MGSQTPKTSLAMLMALLNVRLGYWIPTPNREDWRAHPGAVLAVLSASGILLPHR
jgi:hypothetical protein